MTVRKPLVNVGGRFKELPSGDSIVGAAYISDTAPNPALYPRWLDSTSGILYTWYTAGANSWWVADGALAGYGGVEEGTVFPGSPATGKRFHRTDLHFTCYYDGSRWLSEQQFEVSYIANGAIMPQTTSPGTPVALGVRGDFALYVEQIVIVHRVTGTNSGAAYWTIQPRYTTVATGVGANLGSAISTQSISYATQLFQRDVTTPNTVLSSTSLLQTQVTTTGAPGAIYVFTSIIYRLVVT